MATFDFRGRSYPLLFNGECLYAAWGRFGTEDGFLAAVSSLTPDSYHNLCWLASLLATQGELARRLDGYDKQDFLSESALRVRLRPDEVQALRTAVVAAINEGFAREEAADDDEQVDEVLEELQRQEREAKNAAGVPASAADAI